MAVLLGAQAVSETAGGKFNVIISNNFVFLYGALELAAFDQTFGQISLAAHLLCVHGLAISHIHSVIVEDFTVVQITLCDSTDFDNRPGERSRHGVTEEHDASNCIMH